MFFKKWVNAEFEWDDLLISEIGSWPKGLRVGILVFITVLTFIMGFYLCLNDLIQSYLTEKKIQEQYRAVQRENIIQNNLEQNKETLAFVEENTHRLNQQLPQSPEEASLLEELSLHAAQNGLEMQIFKPAAEENKEAWVERPLELLLVGHYHHLGAFLDSLSTMLRIVTLHDFSIKIKASEPKKLEIKLTAKTYWKDPNYEENRFQEKIEHDQFQHNEKEKKQTPHHYAAQHLRNPFELFISSLSENLQPAAVRNPNRVREPLEYYPLDALHMIGTIAKKGVRLGLVKDAQGMIHLVKEGNYLGQNFGCIEHIYENRLELKEWILNSEGKYEERKSKLGLNKR